MMSWSSRKKKRIYFCTVHFVRRKFVYWIHFQNIHIFTYQKTLLHILFFVFKIVERLQCILNWVRLVSRKKVHVRKRQLSGSWVTGCEKKPKSFTINWWFNGLMVVRVFRDHSCSMYVFFFFFERIIFLTLSGVYSSTNKPPFTGCQNSILNWVVKLNPLNQRMKK